MIHGELKITVWLITEYGFFKIIHVFNFLFIINYNNNFDLKMIIVLIYTISIGNKSERLKLLLIWPMENQVVVR
jgi:hypothetical protein